MKKIIFGVIGILTITLIIYMVLLNYNEEYQFKKKMRKSSAFSFINQTFKQIQIIFY